MLLTICIPTFNRASDLRRALENIQSQLLLFCKEYLQNIELIVVDNFSLDETEMVCGDFAKRFACPFFYYKNPKNIGFDGSIIRLYSLAKGEYVWFLSDDDLILDGGIEEVLGILIEHHPDLCYANIKTSNEVAVAISGGFTNLTHFARSNCFVKLELDKLIYFSNNLERLAHIRLCSFISSCIVKRDPTVLSKLSEYLGTGIMQDAIMNLVLGLDATAYIPSLPIVLSGTKNYVSEWFIHSALFGNHQLYCSRNLKIQDKFNKIISIDSCRFGLMVLADRNSIDVRYKVSGSLFYKIISVYRLDIIYMLREIFLAFHPNFYKICKNLFGRN